MGRQVRVFLDNNDYAMITNQENSKRPNQECFFCDLLDCKQVEKNGKKYKVGTVRLYGRKVTVEFSPQEGCWLPKR